MKAETINLLSNAGVFSAMLLVPLIAEGFGANASEIGIIVAAYAFSLFISSYMFGRLADIHGRRIFLISGLLLSSITCVFQYLAYDTFTLLLTRILFGFTAGIYPAALLAYAYESKRRMNKFLAFGSGGWGLGTLIGGIVATAFSINAPFLFSALLMAMTVPMALRMPVRKEVKLAVPLFPVKVIKRNISVYGPVLVRHTGACSIWVMYPIFIKGLEGAAGAPFFWVGVMFAINSFTQFAVMSQLRRKSSVLIPLGIMVSMLTFYSFTFCTNIWHLMPTQIALAASWALIYVGSIKFIMKHSKERSTATGFLNSILQMSAILGALIGGFVVDLTGDLLAPMYLAAAMSLASLVMYYGLKRYQGIGSKPIDKASHA